ncbi:hypothetical protein HD806DRAFT_115708 [Xylariaceae sp. AK1471]|nr:hypothetical protein HD806DRAFT_115708 [Xylariaceae sp. AK1471]
MAQMTVDQILRVPAGEIVFRYPKDARPSRIDKKYETLRIERRGLRKWECFEEEPAHLQVYLRDVTPYQKGWKPHIVPWQRYAASERMVQDLYGLTLIHRVNVALDTAVPGRLSIIGTPKYFPSWGNEASRSEGQEERNKIAPDWALVLGDGGDPPALEELGENIIAWGDTKLKRGDHGSDSRLPGTYECPEAYLAQVVQYCIDMSIPLGFVLTNYELVVFHVSKYEPEGQERIATRSSNYGTSTWHLLPSNATEETEFSSPLRRTTGDWINFDHGDHAIPFVSKDNHPASAHVPSSPGPRKQAASPRALSFPAQQQRHITPEIPSSSQRSSVQLNSSPPTLGRGAHSPTMSSPFGPDARAEDPTYVFIRSYAADDKGVARRLFELCILAKKARDCGVREIGPWKLSFAALEALDS